MIYLKAKNFSLLQKWRLKQEHKLWLKTKKSSSHKDYEQRGCYKFYADLSKSYREYV